MSKMVLFLVSYYYISEINDVNFYLLPLPPFSFLFYFVVNLSLWAAMTSSAVTSKYMFSYFNNLFSYLWVLPRNRFPSKLLFHQKPSIQFWVCNAGRMNYCYEVHDSYSWLAVTVSLLNFFDFLDSSTWLLKWHTTEYTTLHNICYGQ